MTMIEEQLVLTEEQLAEVVNNLEQWFDKFEPEVRLYGHVALQVIRQLWAEREAMEKESTEQCRIIGAGGERELALMTKIEEQRRDIEKMAAERSKMQEQIALAEHDRDFAERNHARIAANNMRLREQIEQQRAVMAQAKEALQYYRDEEWLGGEDGMAAQAHAALESMGA